MSDVYIIELKERSTTLNHIIEVLTFIYQYVDCASLNKNDKWLSLINEPYSIHTASDIIEFLNQNIELILPKGNGKWLDIKRIYDIR